MSNNRVRQKYFHAGKLVDDDHVDKQVTTNSPYSFYYYIRDGDFDIVWPNVLAFVIAHVILVCTLYNSMFRFQPKDFPILMTGERRRNFDAME